MPLANGEHEPDSGGRVLKGTNDLLFWAHLRVRAHSLASSRSRPPATDYYAELSSDGFFEHRSTILQLFQAFIIWSSSSGDVPGV